MAWRLSVDLAKAVRRRVGTRGLSGFVARAMRHELQREQLEGFIAEMDDALGPVSEKHDGAPKQNDYGARAPEDALTGGGRPSTYARAGDTDGGIVIAPGVQSIDATAADRSPLGHSYFADVSSVLSDIHAIIVEHLAPDRARD